MNVPLSIAYRDAPFKAGFNAGKRLIQADNAHVKKETQIKILTLTSALTLYNFKVAKAALQIKILNFKTKYL